MSQNFYRNYQPLKVFAYLAMSGLAIVILIDFLTAVLCLAESTVKGFFQLIPLLTVLRLPIAIFTIVFFLIWLNRANKNLASLGAENTEFSSGWAVGWWFIPIASLFKPFQVVREVWIESEPNFDADLGYLSSYISAPTYMTIWWAFWVIANIFSNITNLIARDIRSLEFIVYAMGFDALLFVIAGILAIKVIWDITQRQEQRFQRRGNLPQNFQSPPLPPIFN